MKINHVNFLMDGGTAEITLDGFNPLIDEPFKFYVCRRLGAENTKLWCALLLRPNDNVPLLRQKECKQAVCMALEDFQATNTTEDLQEAVTQLIEDIKRS